MKNSRNRIKRMKFTLGYYKTLLMKSSNEF